MDNVCALILAIGEGASDSQASARYTGGLLLKPMVCWVADHCAEAGIASGRILLAEGSAALIPTTPDQYDILPLTDHSGLGHAAAAARGYLRTGGFSHALVLYGDVPRLLPHQIRDAFAAHRDGDSPVTALVTEGGDALGWWLRAGDLLALLDDARPGDGLAIPDGAGAYRVPDTAGRVGSMKALARLNRSLRDEIVEAHLDNGVLIPLTDGVVIGPDVAIVPGTTILPGSVLLGTTRVGAGCEIGPNSHLVDAVLGAGCRILASFIDSSTLGDNVRIGPMSNVRPGCTVGDGVKVGDFVELKNSTVGQKTSVAHLTYVGDSDVGSGCNFGCGVVTVNYDGGKKYRTVVGDDAFVGCNVNLVAPVSIGDRVYAAAGTTITEDVPSDALVIGRARQVIKENWVTERGRYKGKGKGKA